MWNQMRRVQCWCRILFSCTSMFRRCWHLQIQTWTRSLISDQHARVRKTRILNSARHYPHSSWLNVLEVIPSLKSRHLSDYGPDVRLFDVHVFSTPKIYLVTCIRDLVTMYHVSSPFLGPDLLLKQMMQIDYTFLQTTLCGNAAKQHWLDSYPSHQSVRKSCTPRICVVNFRNDISFRMEHRQSGVQTSHS